MGQNHARTCMPHHSPDPFSHGRLVAVNLTLVAGGFGSSKRTFIQADQCVIKEFCAFRAQVFSCFVRIITIDSDHSHERFLFPFDPPTFLSQIFHDWEIIYSIGYGFKPPAPCFTQRTCSMVRQSGASPQKIFFLLLSPYWFYMFVNEYFGILYIEFFKKKRKFLLQGRRNVTL